MFDFINIDTKIFVRNEQKVWIITDIYYNLYSKNVEMMAKRENDDDSMLYIPQEAIQK